MRALGMTEKVCVIQLVLLIFAVFFSAPSEGQGKAYRIGPRDVLTLTICAGGEKQQDIDLSVSSQGMANVPFIGPVKAESLTIPELEALILRPLSEDFFVDPEVHIIVKEYHSLRYHISGAVRSPGLYEMRSEATLMELIAKAGGALPQRGNVAYVLRASVNQIEEGKGIDNLLSHKEPIKVDLKALLDKGDMSCNLVIQSGDVLYIPFQNALNLRESKIYVEGEVNRPGVYDFQEGLTALNACIMAGGFGRFAAPNRTRIIRNDGEEQIVIKIDLNDVKEGKMPDADLKPGDRIHVPETWL